jgi:hypothetical protein
MLSAWRRIRNPESSARALSSSITASTLGRDSGNAIGRRTPAFMQDSKLKSRNKKVGQPSGLMNELNSLGQGE